MAWLYNVAAIKCITDNHIYSYNGFASSEHRERVSALVPQEKKLRLGLHGSRYCCGPTAKVGAEMPPFLRYQGFISFHFITTIIHKHQ